MIRASFIITILFTFSVCIAAQEAANKTLKPIFQATQPFTNIQQSAPTLDDFERILRSNQSNMGAIGYIYVYGGKKSCEGELGKVARIIFGYIQNEREIDTPRMVFVDAGYRSEAEVDLFILPAGAEPPKPTPTLNEKEIGWLNKNNPRCRQLETTLKSVGMNKTGFLLSGKIL